MLRELLLALSGIPGGVFILTSKEEIQVIDSLPFCHPCEREALNRVCRLGSAYFQLKKFIDNRTLFKFPPVNEHDNGLYITAFGAGLQKSLRPYRETLLKLEEEILDDPNLGLSHVESRVEKVHGCAILGVIHSHSATGIPVVKSALKIIQHACHGVMFKQLSSWLLNGILLDPYDEFFVIKLNENEMQGLNEPLQAPGDSSIPEFNKFSKVKKEEVSTLRAKFSLSSDKLPSYIPLNVAETILFVGESIQVFTGDGVLGKYASENSSIFQFREEEFSKELSQLQNEKEFQLSKFETVIDSIRGSVAGALWTLIVENSDLYGHLRALKDFFLLGRGELFLTFLDQANNLLNAIPTTNYQYAINQSFRKAACSLLLEDDKYLEKFSLSVDFQPKKSQNPEAQAFGPSTSTDTVRNFLRMNYKPSKPLHILFTPGILDKYNSVFRFLLNITGVHLELQNCWKLQIEAKHLKESVGNTKQWHLRTCMAFVVDNLLYYIQVDVLETQFAILMDKIRGTRDFQQIQMAHHMFLTNIAAQTFQLMKPLYRCLQDFLDLCLTYCACLKHYTKMTSAELQAFTNQYQKLSSIFFQILSGMSSHPSGSHLSQLAVRIDFNKYFSEGNRKM